MENSASTPKGRHIPAYTRDEVNAYIASLPFVPPRNTGMGKRDQAMAKKTISDAQSDIEKDMD